jgi:hypothetical protein
MDKLKSQLTALKYEVDESLSQHGVLVVKDFGVYAGRHAGKVIDVGIPCSDFPFSAPAGIHVRPLLVPTGANNVNSSPLGSEWQYWSRRLPDWSTDRSARHIISYINKVLLNG